MSFGKNKQSSSSAPLTAEQVASYFGKLDNLSGGRLGGFAVQGTPAVNYRAPSAETVRALGGIDESRRAAIERARTRAGEEYAADPSLSVAQRVRAKQLTDQDALDRLDAINKETSAFIADRDYESRLANARLTREDLEALADIFFGGSGNVSSSKGRGFNLGFGTSN